MMPSTSNIPETISGHIPVSNRILETSATTVKAEVSQPSLVGSAVKANAVKDGVEVVEGHQHIVAEAAYAARAANIPKIENLRDVAEASFGRPGPVAEAIIGGVDNRVQIADPTQYPWSAIASLLITAADNSTWLGTGWFIGPRTLITAGHCVFIRDSGWVKSILVMPGRNGDNLSFGSATSTKFFSVANWVNNGDTDYDYGAIVIPSALGNTVGHFGFGVYSDVDLNSTVGNISGYPSDKPSGTQWFDSRQIASVDGRKVYYQIDTVGGQSGAPVFRIVNGERFAFAIHTYGDFDKNSGTRITTEVYNNLVTWNAA